MTKDDLALHVNICILASGDDTSFNYDMQLQTKYKLLSELIPITDLIQNIFTQSVCLFALEIRCTVCSYGTPAYFVTYVTIRGTINYVHRKAYVSA